MKKLIDALRNTKTPCYIIDEELLTKNLEKLASVKKNTGARILLAQKAFSAYYYYPLIAKYLDGTTASGLNELRLGREHMKGEAHVYAPAFRADEIDEILSLTDHIVFNSFKQLRQYGEKARAKRVGIGLRINPAYSEVQTAMYDPCSQKSRLGIRIEEFNGQSLEGVDGLHFHTMCEQNSDVLERTLRVVERDFSEHLKKMKWLNFGGGHHITKSYYNIEILERCIKHFQDKFGLEIYLEPGEAIALDAGWLASRVLEIRDDRNVILDTSAACHMPDTLEMPYRPYICGSGEWGEKEHNYRFGGPTCLSGDIIGEYSFADELKTDDILIFSDMAHYTMVKNNTFNGMNLPSILGYDKDKKLKIIKEFGYQDFKDRL